MKKILILSDNYNLASALSQIIIEQSLNAKNHFTFCCSASNKSPDSLKSIGYVSVDLKKSEVVDELISKFDLIFSLHCKQIFPEKLVSNVCCVNLHPGFNPHNRGWYPQVFSIINKKTIGATFHIMNKEIDAGPIIFQNEINVLATDTSNSLYDRIQNLEIKMLKEHFQTIVGLKFEVTPVSELGNYNSSADFKKLCRLDLGHVGTLQEHIDLLRALTHSGFKNAYFTDSNNAKIYVELTLKPDNSN